ncbi:MATE family efflux transporter [Anaerorhabdus furcosa]|uniref:Putative efflux protein, MATE family n=1 Tax=Anaerorhabdus furcosa TaxID=118967 RepID=A0A1T4KEE0_9FIRM|nr:MATE family efflux transporter [Anaerorhabdus furcosa]SJZ40782.1 putative efflux protein, MATE family [Anaerorhabdus furcosa]
MTMVEAKMTTGSIWKRILFFAIPLLLGNLFQLLYNTVDSIVVGQYVGKTALAAVGASTPLINLIIGFFMGVAVGAGVIVARHFGANRKEELSVTVHTFVTFSIIFGIVLMIIGYFMSPLFLEWMKTPSDVLPQAVEYLQIYFLGVIFVTLYNAGTGILQAIGDSKRPLYFLGVASVINIILDLYFVTQLNMGVAGVAWATLIAQAVSAVLVIIVLLLSKESYHLRLNKLRIDMKTLIQIIKIGIPSGLQNMIVSFSNVIVQSYVNNFGAAAIAGFSSANKFDNFIALPVNSFALAITTFSAQNMGALKIDRVKKGVNTTILMGIISVILLGIPLWLFADVAIEIFSRDSDVIAAGASMIRVMIPFYTALTFHQVYSGALRAGGYTVIPMITSIISFVFLRQIYLSIAMPIFNHIDIVAWGYSLTWSCAAIFTALYYHFSHWLTKNKLGS